MRSDQSAMPALESAISRWAAARPDIEALVVVGSYARADRPADLWSDLDLVLFVDDPIPYLESAGWLEAIAPSRITFTEPTALGIGRERRVLFEGGLDVDFTLWPATWLDALDAKRGDQALRAAVAPVVARGFRILIDRGGRLSRVLADLERDTLPSPSLPGPEEMDELIQDFWYHAVWTARKLRRGELWVALRCCDGYMKTLLLRMLEWDAHTRDPRVDTWHDGRFLERWADPRTLSHLRSAFARYDESAVWLALMSTMDLFRVVAGDTCARLGYSYPTDVDRYASRLVEQLGRPLSRQSDG